MRGSRMVVQKADVESGRSVALGPECPFQALEHLVVHLAVIALAHLQVFLPELEQEKGPHQERHKWDLLVVEFLELVDPADRIVGLGFAVGEVDDGSMTQSGIAFGAPELRYGPGVLPHEDHPGHGCVACQGHC